MTTLVQALAETAAKTDWDALPDAVRASAPERVLDVLGLCLGALDLDTSAAVIGWVAEQGGAPQASAVGLRAQRVPAAQAALVNGVLAHSLDYDDTHLPSILHPSASVVPAALAAGQAAHADGRRVLTGVAVGVEVCVRLGMAGYDREAGQSSFFERGQHATSICGAIGSAAAAAAVLGLPPTQTADALGIAVSMAGGVIEANRTGGTVKRLHCGWAAHSGVTAAQLAARGITGPPTVLEGRFGFYQSFLSGRFDAGSVTDGLGSDWCLADVHYKPYPANHFTHAVADAALALRAAGLRPDDVDSVEVRVPTPVVRTVGEPLEAKRRPVSGYHAKFSAPWVFTAALLGGSGLGLGHDDFRDELLGDPERERLLDRVSVVGDPDCDALYPQALPATVVVRTTDGRELVERVTANRGGPARPLTTGELCAKFLDNATRAVDAATAQALSDAVLALPRTDDTADLLTVLEESR